MTVVWISDYPIEWIEDRPTELNVVGGRYQATWQRVLLSDFMQNSDLKIHVISLRKQYDRDFSFEKNGVSFHLLKMSGGFRAPSLFLTDSIRIKPLIDRIKPDLIHAWGTEKGAGLVASRLGYPYVITIQGLLSWYQKLVPLNWYERFAALLEKYTLSQASVVTTESVFAVNYLQKKFSKLAVVQAEHAPDWVFHRIERRPKTLPIRFISVGALGHRKGTDLLLQALDQLKSELLFELLLVGSGDESLINSLRESVSTELWQRVTIKQNLLPHEVANELAEATILLFPTRADTSPNAVKEAVVAGIPVVASSIGGIVDYVVEGKNGCLFDSNDVDGFIAAIRRAILNPHFSQGIVDTTCRDEMRDYLSPKRMAINFLKAYRLAVV